MNTLKGWISTLTLTSLLMLSTVSANAGIIIAGRNQPPTDPCSQPTKDDDKDELGGIIIAGAVGIIIAGLTGIIIAGATDEQTECGVIIAG